MRKSITGTVVSTSMKNTVVVMVESKYRHPLYRKVIKSHKRFKAHNELDDVKVGDEVVITETKPISKEKHFIVTKKITNS